MDLLSIIRNENQMDSVERLTLDALEITGQTTALLNRLSKVCAVESVNRYWDTTIVVDGGGRGATVTCPFGPATISLQLVIVSQQVEGVVSIRKEAFDDAGRPIKPLVTSFRVTRKGIFVGEGQEHPIPGSTQVGGDDKEAYSIIGAILYALGACE